MESPISLGGTPLGSLVAAALSCTMIGLVWFITGSISWLVAWFLWFNRCHLLLSKSSFSSTKPIQVWQRKYRFPPTRVWSFASTLAETPSGPVSAFRSWCVHAWLGYLAACDLDRAARRRFEALTAQLATRPCDRLHLRALVAFLDSRLSALPWLYGLTCCFGASCQSFLHLAWYAWRSGLGTVVTHPCSVCLSVEVGHVCLGCPRSVPFRWFIRCGFSILEICRFNWPGLVCGDSQFARQSW